MLAGIAVALLALAGGLAVVLSSDDRDDDRERADAAGATASDDQLEAPGSPAAEPCPTGAPTVTLTEVVATQSSHELWAVTVRGEVTNETSADIDAWGVDVSVVGDLDQVAYGFPDTRTLVPGGSTAFEAFALVASSSARPSIGGVTIQWDWSSSEHVGCPRG